MSLKQTRLLVAIMLVSTSTVRAAPPASENLVINDHLTTGRTVGALGGRDYFEPGGWRVTNALDSIRYRCPMSIEDGAVEFDLTGLKPSDEVSPVGQLMCMYDASVSAPENPWKLTLQRIGRTLNGEHSDELKLSMNAAGVRQFVSYARTVLLPWNPAATYHFKLRWRDGMVYYYINDIPLLNWSEGYHGVYKPKTHEIRIGAGLGDKAIVGALYSNIKVYDYGTAPTALLNNPRPDGVYNTLTPIVDWACARQDAYHLRVKSTSGSPKVVWDSGKVSSRDSYCVSKRLRDKSIYVAQVRLHNEKGWGDWSEPRAFMVDTGTETVALKYREYEIQLLSHASHKNPYLDVALSAVFKGPTKTIKVNGFWDGGNLYKIRMLPTEPGEWSWVTSSDDPDLNDRTGRFLCRDSNDKGYVKVSTKYPYTFEWSNGEPFFLLGDTIWHVWYNVRFSDGTLQKIVDTRASQHFDYIQGVVHGNQHNEGGNIYNVQTKGPRWDCNTLNPAYFQWIDKKIDYMNANGMVAGLFFAWGNGGYKDYKTQEQFERYIKYMVARYASKNVFWIIAGEFEEAIEFEETSEEEQDAQWIAYMNTTRNNDPYEHPISLHTTNTTDRFGNVPAHSFIGQQRKGSPEYLRGLIENSRKFKKPVVNLEYGYESTSNIHRATGTTDDVRRDHWAMTLGGGYGVYGNAVPGRMLMHKTASFDPRAVDSLAAWQLKLLYEFFTGINYRELVPSQNLTDKGICAAWPDNEYVIQVAADDGNITVNLTAAIGTFDVEWFNPRDGGRIPAGQTTGGAPRTFQQPPRDLRLNNPDWILHIYRHAQATGK